MGLRSSGAFWEMSPSAQPSYVLAKALPEISRLLETIFAPDTWSALSNWGQICLLLYCSYYYYYYFFTVLAIISHGLVGTLVCHCLDCHCHVLDLSICIEFVALLTAPGWKFSALIEPTEYEGNHLVWNVNVCASCSIKVPTRGSCFCHKWTNFQWLL